MSKGHRAYRLPFSRTLADGVQVNINGRGSLRDYLGTGAQITSSDTEIASALSLHFAKLEDACCPRRCSRRSWSRSMDMSSSIRAMRVPVPSRI